MKYIIADFKDLVSMWYNEFLPAHMGNKAGFIPEAGIIYLNSMSLEPLKKESLKFLVGKALEISNGETVIFVQEPKPVNNPRIQKFLHDVEASPVIDDDHKAKVLHMANRRYVPVSSDILISQDKEMDEFMDSVFLILSKLNLPTIRFYASSSLVVDEVRKVATGFFPRSALVFKDSYTGSHIDVSSANELMKSIASGLVMDDEGPLDSSTSRFIMMSQKTITSDLECLI